MTETLEGMNVINLGNNEFELVYPKPVKMNTGLFLLTGTHDIKVVGNKKGTLAYSLRGKKEVLIDWLRGLPINKKALDELIEAMK
jgi:hypothetical protein